MARSRSRGRSKSPSRLRKSLARSKSPSRRGKSPGRPAKLTSMSSGAGRSPTRAFQKSLSKSPARHSRRLEEKALSAQEFMETDRVVETVALEKNVVTSSTTTTTAAVTAATAAVKVVAPTEPRCGTAGALGCLLLTVTLPVALIYLNFLCSKTTCSLRPLAFIPKSVAAYYDRSCVLLVIGWLALQYLLAAILPGRVATSISGDVTYKCNGFLALTVSIALFSAAAAAKLPVYYFARKLPQLAVASAVLAFICSVAIYLRSRSKFTSKPVQRSVLYDFFVGCAPPSPLSPPLSAAGRVDVKLWTYLRPGLIGWAVLTVLLLCREYRDAARVQPALGLLAAFHVFYVADALWFEEAFLSSKAMQQDALGFMTVFGSFAWVPFFFSLQTRYLLTRPATVITSYYALFALVMLKVLGYVIYRGSNTQKNIFRRNPFDARIAHMETIPITSKRVLVSGWWRLCRHPNYLGDIIMALSWALLCGGEPIAYLHVAYLSLFLAVRAARDHAYCLQKYGPIWQRYCRRVRYRIVPYVY